MSLDALFAAAGDDEEVLRRAALIIDLAKAKGAASVEAFGARFFFEQPQPEPDSHATAAVDDATAGRPPSSSDTLKDLMARSPRCAGPPLGVPPGSARPAPRRHTQPHPATSAHANASAAATGVDAAHRSEQRRQRRRRRRRQRRGGPGGDHGLDTPSSATPSHPQPQPQPEPQPSGVAPSAHRLRQQRKQQRC